MCKIYLHKFITIIHRETHKLCNRKTTVCKDPSHFVNFQATGQIICFRTTSKTHQINLFHNVMGFNVWTCHFFWLINLTRCALDNWCFVSINSSWVLFNLNKKRYFKKYSKYDFFYLKKYGKQVPKLRVPSHFGLFQSFSAKLGYLGILKCETILKII